MFTWTRKNRIASACNMVCTFFAHGHKSSSTCLAKNRTPGAGYSKLPRQKKIISTCQKRKIESATHLLPQVVIAVKKINRTLHHTRTCTHLPIQLSNDLRHLSLHKRSVYVALMRLLGFRGLWGWEGVVKMSGHVSS